MKHLLATLLLVVASTANATNWQLVSDSDSNDIRLLVDVDTVLIDKYDKHNTGKKTDYRVSSTMTYISDNSEVNFLVIIDADDCLRKGAGALASRTAGETESKISFWSSQGQTMRDAQGQWMCGYLKGTLEVTQPKPKEKSYL